MDTAGWAPQFKSVHLLNEAGRVLVVKNKSELNAWRQLSWPPATVIVVKHMLQTGGELVEFEITVAADQIAMITR